VGRGFSHDVSAFDSSGVLTPEARECHFSVACEAGLILQGLTSWLKPRPTKNPRLSHWLFIVPLYLNGKNAGTRRR
jgi:hypothetical protein